MSLNKRLIVHVGGASGVGKSKVLEIVRMRLRVRTRLVILPVSKLVSRLGKERFDKEWGALDDDQKDVVRKDYVQSIKKIRMGIHILDSHYVDVTTDKTARPIIPSTLYRLIDVYIVVGCPKDALLLRRRSDSLKARPLDAEVIEAELDGELNHARQIAQECKKPLYVVLNDGDSTCAANQICAIITRQ